MQQKLTATTKQQRLLTLNANLSQDQLTKAQITQFIHHNLAFNQGYNWFGLAHSSHVRSEIYAWVSVYTHYHQGQAPQSLNELNAFITTHFHGEVAPTYRLRGKRCLGYFNEITNPATQLATSHGGQTYQLDQLRASWQPMFNLSNRQLSYAQCVHLFKDTYASDAQLSNSIAKHELTLIRRRLAKAIVHQLATLDDELNGFQFIHDTFIQPYGILHDLSHPETQYLRQLLSEYLFTSADNRIKEELFVEAYIAVEGVFQEPNSVHTRAMHQLIAHLIINSGLNSTFLNLVFQNYNNAANLISPNLDQLFLTVLKQQNLSVSPIINKLITRCNQGLVDIQHANCKLELFINLALIANTSYLPLFKHHYPYFVEREGLSKIQQLLAQYPLAMPSSIYQISQATANKIVNYLQTDWQLHLDVCQQIVNNLKAAYLQMAIEDQNLAIINHYYQLVTGVSCDRNLGLNLLAVCRNAANSTLANKAKLKYLQQNLTTLMPNSAAKLARYLANVDFELTTDRVISQLVCPYLTRTQTKQLTQLTNFLKPYINWEDYVKQQQDEQLAGFANLINDYDKWWATSSAASYPDFILASIPFRSKSQVEALLTTTYDWPVAIARQLQVIGTYCQTITNSTTKYLALVSYKSEAIDNYQLLPLADLCALNHNNIPLATAINLANDRLPPFLSQLTDPTYQECNLIATAIEECLHNIFAFSKNNLSTTTLNLIRNIIDEQIVNINYNLMPNKLLALRNQCLINKYSNQGQEWLFLLAAQLSSSWPQTINLQSSRRLAYKLINHQSLPEELREIFREMIHQVHNHLSKTRPNLSYTKSCYLLSTILLKLTSSSGFGHNLVLKNTIGANLQLSAIFTLAQTILQLKAATKQTLNQLQYALYLMLDADH